MILSVLQKVEIDQAEIVMVVPLWPTATWFSKLLSLLIEKPRVFKKSSKMLSHPLDVDLTHPLSDKNEPYGLQVIRQKLENQGAQKKNCVGKVAVLCRRGA